MRYFRFCFILFFVLFTYSSIQAQPVLKKDYSFVMDVPEIINIASSEAHFYALSRTEGMAVFRSRPDSLQWLYSSTGMQRRGNHLVADIRFAYLFGDGRRLTILEPTSVLGVYSSTNLPARPMDVKRMGQNLYVALGAKGLAKLSLESPETVAEAPQFIALPEIKGQEIVSLEGTNNRLFVLAGNNQLYLFNYDSPKLSLVRSVDLSENINRLFLANQTLYGSTPGGAIFEIDGQGELSELGAIGEEVTNLVAWQDWLVIRGTSNRLWTSYRHRSPTLWKKDTQAGNYITVSNNQIWLSEYNQITQVVATELPGDRPSGVMVADPANNGPFSIAKIQDYTIPHSKSLLFPIKLKGNVSAESVQFTYQSPDIRDAELRGQSFYWEPSSDDVGSHRVTIIASTRNGRTATTRFDINIRSFNSPPRFTPVRAVTIPVGRPFSLPINAIDPDGINKNLIRFLGVNLPEGASLNESTGTVRWTPTPRQVGKNTFRVIATDQYGAASSVDVTINVVDNIHRSGFNN